jgi:DNA-binding transcriptional LysR family regulator
MYSVLLLERSGRKLKTTEAGETLYYWAKELIKVMDKTKQAMEEVSESHKGSLSVGASTIPGHYIVPFVIKKFKDKYPSINISIDIADTEKIFYQVADRQIDVGVVGAWINNRKVEGFQWLEDELVVILPVNHKFTKLNEIDIEQLINERWIFREKGSGTRKAVEQLLATNGLKKEDLNIYIETGSTEAVLAAVESGMGLSIVSSWAVKRIDSYRKIKSLKINNSNANRYIYIIYPRQKARRKSVNKFIEYVKTLQELQ